MNTPPPDGYFSPNQFNRFANKFTINKSITDRKSTERSSPNQSINTPTAPTPAVCSTARFIAPSNYFSRLIFSLPSFNTPSRKFVTRGDGESSKSLMPKVTLLPRPRDRCGARRSNKSLTIERGASTRLCTTSRGFNVYQSSPLSKCHRIVPQSSPSGRGENYSVCWLGFGCDGRRVGGGGGAWG